MKTELNATVEIPEGVEVKIEKGLISAKGPKGEVSRRLLSKKIEITLEGKEIKLTAKKATKREKTLMGTFKSHIKNIVQGANEGFIYKMKVCSSHFPITAEVKDKQFSIKNYLGENVPRELTLKDGVDVKVEGDIINIESPDKELAGTTASAIEELCKIRNKDRRIFQDGIFMIEKAGKPIK